MTSSTTRTDKDKNSRLKKVNKIKMKIKFSIIVPVFNCQSTIEKLTIKIIKVISLYSYSFEIILVDDFSQDKSWDILKNLRNKKIKKLKYSKIKRISANISQ